MKKLFLIASILVATLLASCGDDYREVPKALRDRLHIKVLKHSDEDNENVPKDLTILCVDGVKYLMTQQGGITVKFQANREGDPSAEECDE
jgi:hypothetical protein